MSLQVLKQINNNLLLIHQRFNSKYRYQVLSLYRSCLNLAKDWVLKYNGSSEDANYIKNEAKSLFRKNSNLTDNNIIKMHLDEAKSRIDLAIHYKNPYPRPANFPPRTLAGHSGTIKSIRKSLNDDGGPLMPKRSEKNLKDSVPSYLKSYRD